MKKDDPFLFILAKNPRAFETPWKPTPEENLKRPLEEKTYCGGNLKLAGSGM